MSDQDAETHTPEPVKWCPGCEPDLAPTGTLYTEEHCWRHQQVLEGEGDRLMIERLGEEPTKEQTDPSTQRAWGEFLRRPR